MENEKCGGCPFANGCEKCLIAPKTRRKPARLDAMRDLFNDLLVAAGQQEIPTLGELKKRGLCCSNCGAPHPADYKYRQCAECRKASRECNRRRRAAARLGLPPANTPKPPRTDEHARKIAEALKGNKRKHYVKVPVGQT